MECHLLSEVVESNNISYAPALSGAQSLDRRAVAGGLALGGWLGEDSWQPRSLGSLGSKQSLGQMSGVSDSPEKYRDIAL